MTKFDYLIIVQARMGSKRFPGKSMHDFNGSPTLSYLLDSLFQSFDRAKIIVATSDQKHDEVICEFCEEIGIGCYRGDEENVALRFYNLLNESKPKYFVRLNGDSPLFDYRILVNALLLLNDLSIDIITTVKNSFPSGMNVEIIKTEIFLKNYSAFSKQEHFEHVTKYFYKNKERFNILDLKSDISNSKDYKFTFDTAEDKKRIELLLNNLLPFHYSYTMAEKCNVYKKLFHNS